MENISALLLVIGMVVGGVFWVGQWTKASDIYKDCNEKGNFTASKVVFTCKPVAAMVNGKRVELSP